jgi:hypothetical protein
MIGCAGLPGGDAFAAQVLSPPDRRPAMNRRESTCLFLSLLGAGPALAASEQADAASGIRAALERGALAAVAELGRTDGFLGNPQVRIALPKPLEEAARLLKTLGQGRRVDELVTAMNRAAEAAIPEAKALFVSTIRAISVQDAVRIVRGGQTSVTDFFEQRTRAPLGDKFLPIVTRATGRLQLAQRYDAFAAKAASLGLVRGDDANLERHVTARALDGLYRMVGEEEKRIRADPLKTGSAILRKVFGG